MNTYGPDPVEPGLIENTAEVDGYYEQCLVEDSATAYYLGDYGGCTYTIGFWKTHPFHETWELLEDGIATEFFDTGVSYFKILWTPSAGGNAYIILAHQYIAAELNSLMNGNLPDSINENWSIAMTILDDDNYDLNISIPKDDPNRDLAITIANTLDNFNNGNYPGWPHCDDPGPRSRNLFKQLITEILSKSFFNS
jgi:hypothetical protein